MSVTHYSSSSPIDRLHTLSPPDSSIRSTVINDDALPHHQSLSDPGPNALLPPPPTTPSTPGIIVPDNPFETVHPQCPSRRRTSSSPSTRRPHPYKSNSFSSANGGSNTTPGRRQFLAKKGGGGGGGDEMRGRSEGSDSSASASGRSIKPWLLDNNTTKSITMATSPTDVNQMQIHQPSTFVSSFRLNNTSSPAPKSLFQSTSQKSNMITLPPPIPPTLPHVPSRTTTAAPPPPPTTTTTPRVAPPQTQPISIQTQTQPPRPNPPNPNTQNTYLIRANLRYSPSSDTVHAWLELPGVSLSDVQITVNMRSSGQNYLIITAQRPRPVRLPGELWVEERLSGTMTRSFIVPAHVTAKDIRAEMRNGVLGLEIRGTKSEKVTIKHNEDGEDAPQVIPVGFATD